MKIYMRWFSSGMLRFRIKTLSHSKDRKLYLGRWSQWQILSKCILHKTIQTYATLVDTGNKEPRAMPIILSGPTRCHWQNSNSKHKNYLVYGWGILFVCLIVCGWWNPGELGQCKLPEVRYTGALANWH